MWTTREKPSKSPSRGTEIIEDRPPTAGIHRRLGSWIGRDWDTAALFIAPAAVLLLGLIAYPFVRALYLSFTRTHGGGIGPFIGLANYRALWGDHFFRDAVGVTVRFTLSSMVIKFVLAVAGAVILHRLGTGADWIAGMILLPWIMPQIVRAITWRSILDPLFGAVNRLLLDSGLLSSPYPFFGDMDTALPSVILVEVWQGLPFLLINLLAGVKAIDQELYEAAAIDGASTWRQFLHITLPGLRYVIAVVLLLDFIWTFNSFELIFLLTNGGPANATKVYSVLAYEYATRGRWYSRASAAALSMFPVFVPVIALLGRYLMSGHRLPKAGGLFTRIGWRPNGGDPDALIELPGRRAGGALWWLADRLDTLFAWLTPARPGRWAIPGRTVAIVGLSLLLIFELAPFGLLVINAFKSEAQVSRFESMLWPRPWSPEQFQQLLAPASRFPIWLRNTVYVSLITPLAATLIAALCAYALTRLRWRGARLVADGMLVAYLLPPVLLVIPIHQIFRRLGLIDTLTALLVSYPALILPFAVWLLMGHFAALPDELEAAALVDGCSRGQAFFRIILPLTQPGLVAVALFGVTRAWNEFLFAFTFIGSEQKMTLPVGLGGMIRGDVLPWGRLSAAALIMALPVLGLYLLGQKFLVAGLTAGAVKG